MADIKKLIGDTYLKVAGWSFEGEIPRFDKYVLVAAPHTTNWDLPLTLALAWQTGLKPHWMGKHTLFRRPFGGFMKALGGLPVDRRARHNMVSTIVERFQSQEKLLLVVPPEGTRSARDTWKSGFYRIAEQAKLPIVLGFLDYSRKVGGFGPTFRPSGNLKSDMDKVRAFYTAAMAKYPAKFRVPRLRDEAETSPVQSTKPIPESLSEPMPALSGSPGAGKDAESGAA